MLDRTDRRLLDAIQQDATRTLAELAELVGLSRNACWTRLRRLEDEGYVLGRRALLNREKLNLGLMVFVSIKTDNHSQAWAKDFRRAVADLPEIVGVFRTAGETDYLIQAVVPDVKAYDALYQRLTARLTLSDVSGAFVMEEIKATSELPLDYA
ncbi:transcriptional regulator, AsnC family [Tistlia consotensis]|uniref:Transcriptional regulator, AsnC family n=1 Tax=Tistlia consotensis USBA 355 TaxID=560819 RepID=A0A1Y6CXQ3_9PROT|nr:Lrp/AsnC family transcriptional regulator [Tistlia consotensis]SMF84477.1 transcriptional regulator, AsnC family [Tistlia consotensis USBA 355]SNS36520.1 transcriptional regulator, AsnC family [Tistlia consotensis]